MFDQECPFCDTEFDVKVWEDGKCPNPDCAEEYYWDEQCTEDYSDCWSVILWEKYNV